MPYPFIKCTVGFCLYWYHGIAVLPTLLLVHKRKQGFFFCILCMKMEANPNSYVLIINRVKVKASFLDSVFFFPSYNIWR